MFIRPIRPVEKKGRLMICLPFCVFFWNTKTDVVRGNVFINFCNAFS